MKTKEEKPPKARDKSLTVGSVIEMFRNMVAVSRMICRDNAGLLIRALVITIFMALMSFMRSGANALVVNELTVVGRQESGSSSALKWFVSLLIISYALPGLIQAFRRYTEKLMHTVMSETFEMITLRKKVGLDMARHEDPAFQDLSNSANEKGVFSLISLIEGQYEMFASVAGLVIASSILLSSDLTLLIMVCLGEIPSLITQFRYSHNVWDIYDSQSTTKRKFYHLRNKLQGGSSLFELQVFQNTEHFLSRIGTMLKIFNSETLANDRQKFRADIISSFVSTLAISLAMTTAMMKVIHGETQVGTWLFITGTLFSFQNSFSGLFNTLARQYQNSLFVSDWRKVLATPRMIELPKNGIKVCHGKLPTIEFRNVTFTYPDQTEPVLRNLSLKIKPGEILAIVGENGAGKTTLAMLICRVYDPDKGEVLIDGINLKEIDIESWYAELAILSQWYSDYKFTVEEVIALGRTNIPMTRERVLEAAKSSGANVFIEKYDGQYSQQLGHEFGGINPSRGQDQRLALARALYRNAHFMILDEPTAATDAKAEAAIFERLFGLKGKISALLISHNFANAMRADRICVLDNGSIAEIGTHAELMGLNGIYAKLFTLQAERFME